MSTATQILLLKVAAVLLIASLVSGCATHPVTIGSLAPLQDESENGEVLKGVEKGMSTGAVVGIVVAVVAVAGSAGDSGGDTQEPSPQPITCPRGQIRRGTQCVTPAPTCLNGQTLVNGVCTTPPPTCTGIQTLVNGVCVTPPPTPVCENGEKLMNGECVSICRDGFVVNGNVCDPTFLYTFTTAFNNLVPSYGDLATNYCERIKSSSSNVRYIIANNAGVHQRTVARYADLLGQCIEEIKGVMTAHKWIDVMRVDDGDPIFIFEGGRFQPLAGDIIVMPVLFNSNMPQARVEVDEDDIPPGGFPWVIIHAGDNDDDLDDPFRNFAIESVEILMANLDKGVDNFAILTSSTGNYLRCVDGSDSKREFPERYYKSICPHFIAFSPRTLIPPTAEQLEGTTNRKFFDILYAGLDPGFESGGGTSLSSAGVGVILTAIMKIYDLQRADQALDILFAAAVPTEGIGARGVVNLEMLFNAEGILRTLDDTLGILGLKTALQSMSLPFGSNSVEIEMTDNFGRPLNVGFDVARSYGFESVVCRTFCSNHKLTNWLSVDFGDNLIGTGFHLGNLSLSFKENVNGSKDFFGNHLGSGSVERSVTSLSYKTKFVELSSYKDDRNAKAFGLGIDGSVYSHSLKFNLPLKKVRFDLSLTSKEFSGSVNAGGYSLDLANIKQKDITLKAVIPF